VADDADAADGELKESTTRDKRAARFSAALANLRRRRRNQAVDPTDSSEGSSQETTEEPATVAVEPAEIADDADDDLHGEGDEEASEATEAKDARVKRRMSPVRLALVLGLVTAAGLAGTIGWLGHQTYQSHKAQDQRNLFVRAGRQAALNLTTINFNEVDVDVQRILDSSTGAWRDDFQKRSQPFIDIVKQAQSKSEGTVTEAGLESQEGDTAQVLVAVAVKTTSAGAGEQQPRAWRMRIILQKVGADAKVSNVEFVP
jgi:Mce-associated membrane protein